MSERFAGFEDGDDLDFLLDRDDLFLGANHGEELIEQVPVEVGKHRSQACASPWCRKD